MHEKIDTYLVNVTILEGRHYAWPSMDSFVHVRVGNQKHCTRIRKSTDCPYYNEYFVFEFKTGLQDLLDRHITLTVVRPRTFWRRKKILGYCTLDVATIWGEKEHIFYQKWAIISSHSSEFSGPRGYLKVTLCVTGTGEQANIPLANPNNNEEIEGNLLLPDGLTLERQRALFIFKVYKGEDFTKVKPTVMNNIKKSVVRSKEMPTSSVQITFAGLTVTTSVQKNTIKPVWNEMLTIAELFPPLCQRVKIQLKFSNSSTKAVKYLNLYSIANDQEKGFLPTFGPAYIHFYTTDKFGDVFVGKILIALHTQLQHEYFTTQKHMTKKNIVPLNEATLWKHEPVLLFCAILNVTAIDPKFSSKAIRFEISIGNPHLEDILGAGEGSAPNVTPRFIPQTVNKGNWYLDFGHQLPCIFFQSSFPDLRKRFYNANMIERVALELKGQLDEIEPLFEYERNRIPSMLIETKLVEALDALAVGCRKYIDIVKPGLDTYVTDLDREKYKLCIREMEDIEELAKIVYNTKAKKKSYRKAQKIYKRLDLLIDHPQDCWPDVLIYMIYGHKKVATYKIESEDVTYSMVDEEVGKDCAKIKHLYFDTPLKLKSSHNATAACKMDVFMWLGLKRHMEFCFYSLPECYKFPKGLETGAVPPYLIVPEKCIFQCRAHIYQGKFQSCSDSSGLADFCAKVMLNRQAQKTRVIKAMLNPIWDETLTFQNVVFYGSITWIKKNPPTVIVEIIDNDDMTKDDFIGRALITPIVKMKDEPYTAPDYPPRLKWHAVNAPSGKVGEILACIEIFETADTEEKPVTQHKGPRLALPVDIKPTLASYKIDVLFWGLRELRKLHMIPIIRPRVTLDCNMLAVESDVLTRNELNFSQPKRSILVNLPVEDDFISPFSFKLFDNRSFGRFTYVGNNLTYFNNFMHYPITKEERDMKIERGPEKSYDSMDSNAASLKQNEPQARKSAVKPLQKIKTQMQQVKFEMVKETVKKNVKDKGCCACCKWLFKRNEKLNKILSVSTISDDELEIYEDEFTDWWTKFFASSETTDDSHDEALGTTQSSSKNFRIKIYNSELENQQEFNGLQDTLAKFVIMRGERTGDEDVDDKNIMGVLKANIKIYRWPPPKSVYYVTPTGLSIQNGFFQDVPINESKSFLVRIYCVRAIKLRPKDITGKSDPFLIVSMGQQKVNDSKNYIPKDINPVFGKCFEFSGTFPKDSIVAVSVWDWDRTTEHDLIGETKIDIENRFYTKHRANCGLPYDYIEIGNSPWRDQEKPTAILAALCKKNNLATPEYFATHVKIGQQTFAPGGQLTFGGEAPPQKHVGKEELALEALHRWNEVPVVGCHLVPEHVETRSLYHPHKPGLEQGKLQLWVDVFPCTDLPPPRAVEIAPRTPQGYELRLVVWNTEDVILDEDDFFVGEKKSDIYVKGWLTGPEQSQKTDVHYRSLSGEGNFNWRFVFPFYYVKTENKIIVKKKERAFDITASEQKIPCRLKLQVWDNDTFSPDDFLGTMALDLIRMPRGARSSKKCTLQLLEPLAPTINLFRIRRTRGWWPFRGIDKVKNEYILAGKLEAEFELVTEEEAKQDPVGKGRSEPHALPKPNRPDTSFSWFKNPFKLLKYLICKHYRWKIIRCAIFLALCLMIGLAVYAFPGYTVKKFLGA